MRERESLFVSKNNTLSTNLLNRKKNPFPTKRDEQTKLEESSVCKYDDNDKIQMPKRIHKQTSLQVRAKAFSFVSPLSRWLSLFYPPYAELPPLVATFTDFFEASLPGVEGFEVI